MKDNALIGLAEAIESLRSELMTAISEGESKPMRFSLEPIELTVQAVVTKDAEGKIGWQLIGAGVLRGGPDADRHVEADPMVEGPADGTLTNNFTIAGAGASDDTFGPVHSTPEARPPWPPRWASRRTESWLWPRRSRTVGSRLVRVISSRAPLC